MTQPLTGKLAAVAGATAIASALALTATASPANAATGWDRCTPSYSCYFSEANGNGSYWRAPSCGWHKLPFRAFSMWNRGGGKVWFYKADYNWDGWGPYNIGYKGSVGGNASVYINVAC